MAPVPPAGNRDSPNKSQELTPMDSPDFIINADSSSSDDDDLAGFSHQGYELLPQEAVGSSSLPSVPPASQHNDTSMSQLGDVDAVVMETLDAEDGPQSGSLFDVSDMRNTAAEERRVLWGGQTTTPCNTKMSQAEADQIKSALSGFTLPAAHTPDWARVVSEDEWKAQLLSRLSQPITASQHNSSQPIRDAQSKAESSQPITAGISQPDLVAEDREEQFSDDTNR